MARSGQVRVTGKDAAAIETARRNLQGALLLLGEHRHKYIAGEVALVQSVEQARLDLKALVGLVGKRNGVDVDAAHWDFDMKSKVFTKGA